MLLGLAATSKNGLTVVLSKFWLSKKIPVPWWYNGVDGTSCLKVPAAKVNLQNMPQINSIQFVAFIFSCNRGYIWVGKVNYSYPSLGCKDIPEPTISLGKIIL